MTERAPSRLLGRRPGVFLIQAMVFVVLMALMATLVLWVSLGRHMLVHRANVSDSQKHLAMGVESQVQACLEGTLFGRTNCSLPASAECRPMEIGGRTVTVSASGDPPDCRLQIKVAD